MDSLPSQFQAVAAELEEIKGKLLPLADGATSFSEADANAAFEFKEPPVLKEKAAALRSQISDAANLENEIIFKRYALEANQRSLSQATRSGWTFENERLSSV